MGNEKIFLCASLTALAPAASAQSLIAVDSTNDKVLLLDAFDGHVVNPAYIDLLAAGSNLPIDAVVVGNEIWVSDQSADKIMRFTLDGTTHLGDIVGGLDNIRGMEFVNGELYVSNFGNTGGAPGPALVRFSPAGVNLGSFPVGDPFDVIEFQGGLLVCDITAFQLVRYSYTGTNLGVFHDSDGLTGIDFPEQLALRANGNVLAAGFITPGGVYEYDSTGAQINYWPVSTTTRGVHELGNGMIIYGAGTGFHSLDPATGISTPIATGFAGRYINKLATAASPFTTFCPGDGSGTSCPCGNNSAVGAGEGCLSSLGTGGKLSATGSASLASDSVSLNGTQMPSSSALYFQGTLQLGGGAGAVFGDGLRCASGTIIRLKTVTNVAGVSHYPEVGDPSISVKGAVAVTGARTYQVWYRNAAAFCTPATFNLTNGLEVNWGL
jgi:hypothetical protein